MTELPEIEINCNFEIRIRKHNTPMSLLRRMMKELSSASQIKGLPLFLAVVADSTGSRSLWAYDRTGKMCKGFSESIRMIELNNGELVSRITYGIKTNKDDG